MMNAGTRLVLGGIVALVLLFASAALAASPPVLTATTSPAASMPPRPSYVPNATPNRVRSGGPYIGEARALEIARELAGRKASPGRTAVQMLRFADITAWQAGAVSLTIDPLREVYLTVISAPYEPSHGLVHPGASPRVCGWYATVIDATDGTKLQLLCGDGEWPTSLPAAFRP
jgi:hypothetical protein